MWVAVLFWSVDDWSEPALDVSDLPKPLHTHYFMVAVNNGALQIYTEMIGNAVNHAIVY